MDKNILPRLSGLPTSLTVSAEYDSSKVEELKKLADEPEAWEYIQFIEEKEHNFHWVFQGQLESCKFALYPAILKK